MDSEITIGNENYAVVYKSVPQKDLLFYIENPRVYSMFDRSTSEPSQDEMESKLCSCDDVRELRDSIEVNGGLTNPVVVCKGVVIEGNRRLAAYRMLFKKNMELWSNISALILPDDIAESAILTYLGQIHIVGQKDWAPFEQAGFLYRSMERSKLTREQLSSSTGLKLSDVKKMISIYSFMVQNDDLESKHWSYYEQYLSNKAIKDARKSFPELDNKIVIDVKAGKITDAKKEVREQLGVICKAPNSSKLLEDYINNEKTLADCFSSVDEKDIDAKRVIDNFRKKIVDPDIRGAITSSIGDERNTYLYDLETIKRVVDSILSNMRS